jgi:hypothetical protein
MERTKVNDEEPGKKRIRASPAETPRSIFIDTEV